MIFARPVIPVIPHPTFIPKDKKLFIDATDPKQFVLVSGDITYISDKFGFGDFQQTVAGSRPTLNIGNKEIDFNDTTDHLTSGSGGYIYSTSNGLSIFALIKSDKVTAGGDNTQLFIDFGAFNGAGYGMAYTSDNLRGYSGTSIGGVDVPVIISSNTGYRRVAMILNFTATQKLYLNNTEVKSDNITLTKLTAVEINESSTRQSNSSPVTLGVQGKTSSEGTRFFGKQLKCIIIYADEINSYFRNQLDLFMKVLESR